MSLMTQPGKRARRPPPNSIQPNRVIYQHYCAKESYARNDFPLSVCTENSGYRHPIMIGFIKSIKTNFSISFGLRYICS